MKGISFFGERKGAIGWHKSAIEEGKAAIGGHGSAIEECILLGGQDILVFGEEFLPSDGTDFLREGGIIIFGNAFIYF